MVALDVTGTVTQLTGERNRRLTEVDAKLTHARRFRPTPSVRSSGWMHSCEKA